MASLRRSARLQIKKAKYDEKFIQFSREQRRLKCRKAACGFSPVRAQNKLEPFPYEDDSPARSQRISLALTGLFSSAKKSSPNPKYGGRNRRQYVAQASAAQVSKSFDSSDSSADSVTPQRYSKTLEHSRNTPLNSDDCTIVPTSAGSSPATEKFNSVKKLKTPVVVLEQLPQCCISSSPVRAFGETAELSRLPVPSEISSNDDGLASPGWDTASTCSYHDYNEVCLNKPCADDEPKPYNRETQNDKLTHGPGNGLVFASLEIADNERVDNETLGDMLEVCARMAEIHPEETEWSDNYPSTSATCCDGASRYNSETCYQSLTNTYPEGDEPGWQMDETECAVQSLLEQSFQADQPTLNQGAESANLLSGAGTLNKASQELPGKYPSQQSMLQVDSKQDGSGEGSKKKRGRPKKHKTPCKVPPKGVSKKTSQHKVTKNAAGQRDVKMKAEADAKSETVGKPDRPPREKKASHKFYNCTFCKFRTPDKAEKAAHDKVCHPHRCPFCQRHFFTQENLAVHKVACVLENFQQCKVCDQGYTKSRRKRHFHSRKHSHLVKMVRDVGKALRHGSLESYLASITCDHLSDCQVCHPAWINLDQEFEDQPDGDQTEGVKQNSLDSESPQIKEQGVRKDVSSAVSTGSASENLQGAASLLSEGNCFVYTTPPEGCDSHSFQNAGKLQEQVYDVFHLHNQSAGSVQEHDLVTFCCGDQNTGSLRDRDLPPCHLGGKHAGSRQEHDLATFCSGDQNTGSLQNHDLIPCHLGGKNAGSTEEHDLTVFHLDGRNLESLQECKLTTYDLDEQRSQTMQQRDLTKFYFGDQRTGFLQEPDLAPCNFGNQCAGSAQEHELTMCRFGNQNAGSAQEHDLTMCRFGNQGTRPVQENYLTTCHFDSPDVKSVETPDFATCFSEKQKLQSMQEQGSKCHTRNHSPMNSQQVLIESGPLQGQVINVYNPASQVVAGCQSSVINPTLQEMAMHELQDLTKLEGNSADYSDVQNRLAVNNHDCANFPAVSKHTSISYSLQNDSSVKLQEGFLNPLFLTEQTHECELETQPASSNRDSLADPNSERQNPSTTSRVDVPDTVLYCGESLTCFLLGQKDAQELGTQPANCSKSSIIDTSPDPQRKKPDTSTSTVHATEALSCQEKSVHSCESASQGADTFTDLLELLDECDLSSADLPDETVGGLDIMEICEDSSSDDGHDTNKAIEQGQDLEELTPVQCAAVKRAAQGEVTEVVDRNLFKDFIQQPTADEKRLVGGSVCVNRKSYDEKLLPAPSRDGSGVGSSGKDATCNELGMTQSIDKRGYLHCITEGFVRAHENARSRAAAEGKPDGAVNQTKSHDKMVPRQSGKGSLLGDTADVGQDRELLQLCYSAQNIGPQDGTLCTHHLEQESFTDYEKHPESVSASVVTVSRLLVSDVNQKTDNIENQACPMKKTGICISTDMTMNVTKQEVSCADSDTARFSDMDMVMFDATKKLLDAVSTQTDTSIRCASPAPGIPLIANSSDIDIPPRPVPSTETLSWLSESLSPTSNIRSATALSLMTLDADRSEAASGPTSSRVTSTAIIPTVGLMAVNSSEDPATDAGVLSQGIKAVNSSEDPTTDAGVLSQGIKAVNSSEDPTTDAGILSQGIKAVNSSEDPTTDAGVLSQGIKAVNSSEDPTTDAGILSQGIKAVNSSEDPATDAGVLSQGRKAVNSSEDPTTDGGVLSQGIKAVNSSEDPATDAGILSQGIKAVNSSEDPATDAGILSQGIKAVNSSEDPTTDAGISSHGIMTVNSPGASTSAVCATTKSRQVFMRSPDVSQPVSSPTTESTQLDVQGARLTDGNVRLVRQSDERTAEVRQLVESTSARQKEERTVLGIQTKQGVSVATQTQNTALLVMQSHEAAKAIIPEESSALKTPADKGMAVVRPRDESPSVVRPRDESPSVVRPRDESQSVVRPRDESPLVVRPRDESPPVVRPRDESLSVVRPRDESPSVVRPRDESPSVVRPRDESPSVVRPRGESPSVVRPRDESPSVVRPRGESPSVVRPRGKSPSVVRPRDESPSVVRPRDKSPSVVRPRDESPSVVRPRDESPSVVRPRGESMRAADEGTAVVGISDERTCMVMTRNESTAVLRPRDQSTPGVGLAGESSPVVTPRDTSTLDVMPAGVIRLAHGMTQAVRTPDKDTPVFRPVAQVMPEVTETAVKTTAIVAPNLEPETRSASAVMPGTSTIPAVQSETRFTSCKPMSRRTPKVGGTPDDSPKNHPKSLNGLTREKVAAIKSRTTQIGTGTQTIKQTSVNTHTPRLTTFRKLLEISSQTSTTLPSKSTPTTRTNAASISVPRPNTTPNPTASCKPAPSASRTPPRPSGVSTQTPRPRAISIEVPLAVRTPSPKPTIVTLPVARASAVGTPKASTVSTLIPSAVGTPKASTVSTLIPSAVGTPKASTVGTLIPSAVGTPKASTVGTLIPSAVGTPKASTVSTLIPSAVATPKASTVGTLIPSAVGTPKASTVGTLIPSAVGTPKASTVNTLIPSAVGTPKASTVSTLIPSAVGTPKASTVNTLIPSAVGTPKASTVGTLIPSAVGTPKASTVSTLIPSAVGTPKASTVSTLMPSAVGTPKASTVSTLIPSAVGTPKASTVNTLIPSAVGTPKASTVSTQPPRQSAVCTPKPSAMSTQPPRYSAVGTPKPSLVSTQTPTQAHSAVFTPKPNAKSRPTPSHSSVSTSTQKPIVITINIPLPRPTAANTATPMTKAVGTATLKPTVLSTPTSKPTMVGKPTSKPTMMGTPTSKPTMMGTPTSKPTTMGTHTLEPIALDTPTSKPTVLGTHILDPIALGTPTSKPTTMGTPTSKPTTMGSHTLEPTTGMGTHILEPIVLDTPTSKPTTMGTPTSKPTTMGSHTLEPTTMGTHILEPIVLDTPTSKPTTMGIPSSKPTALSTPTSSIVTMGTPAFKPSVVGTPTSRPADVGTPTSNPTTMGIPALKPTALGTPTLKHIALGTPTSKPTAVSTSVPGHASISRSIPRHADAKTPSPRPTYVTTPRLRATGPNTPTQGPNTLSTPTPRPGDVRRPICTYRAVNTPMPRHIAMRVTPTLGTASTPTSKPIAASTPTSRCSAISRPVCTYRPPNTCSAVITPKSRPTAVNSPIQGPTPVNSPTFKPVRVATPRYRPVVKGTVPRHIAPNTKRPRCSTLSTLAPTPQSPSTSSLGPSALSTRAYQPTATSTSMSGTSTRGITPRSTIAGTHLSATFPVGTPIPGPRVVNTSTSPLQAGNTNIAMITPSSASGCGMKVTKDNWQHCSGQAESQDSQQLSDYTPSLGSLAGIGMTTKGTVRRLKFGEGLISTCRQDTQRCGETSRKRFFCNQESTGMENCDRKAARSSYAHRVAIGMDVQAKSTLCEKTTMSCSSRKRSTHLPGGDSAARSTSKASLANISNDNGCTALLTGVFPTTSSCGKLCARTEPTLMPSSTTMRYTSDKEEHLSHTRRSTILAPRNQQHTVPELDRFCPASATVKRHRQEIVTNAHIKRKCNRKNPLFPFAQASQPKKPKLCECERDTYEGRSPSQLCNRAVRSQVMQSRDDANIPTLQKVKDSQLSVAPYQNSPGVRANTCDPADLQVAHNTFSDDSKSAVGDSVKDFNCSQENVGPAEPEVSYDTNSYLISGNGTVIPGNISLCRYDGRLPTPVYVSHSMLPDSPLLQSVSAQQYFHHERQYLTSPVSAHTETSSPFMQAVAFSRAGMSNPFVPVSVAARTSMEDRDSLLHRPGLNSLGSSEA